MLDEIHFKEVPNYFKKILIKLPLCWLLKAEFFLIYFLNKFKLIKPINIWPIIGPFVIVKCTIILAQLTWLKAV